MFCIVTGVVTIQLYTFIKTHQTVHFNVYKLYLIYKTLEKEKRENNTKQYEIAVDKENPLRQHQLQPLSFFFSLCFAISLFY